MNGLIMHLLVTFAWLFLIGSPTMGGLFGGLFAGYLLLVTFRRALSCENYVRRTNALFRYMFYFSKEVLLSNFRIARIALSKNPRVIIGQFVAYDVEGMSKFEILFLSHCLNLTPGSIVSTFSVQKSEIVIHTFSSIEADTFRAGVDEMKIRIMRFSR